MKKCSHCGYLNDDGNKFCRKCGQLFPVPASQLVVMPQKRKGKGKRILLLTVILFLLAALGVTVWKIWSLYTETNQQTAEKNRALTSLFAQEDSEDSKTSDEEKSEDKQDTGETKENFTDQEEPEPETEQPEETSDWEDEYILPYSDTRYLDWADLEGLSQEECRLARNEIYARHGRIFDDENLQAYFESKSWYEGTIPGNAFSEDMLSECEIYNRDLIIKYEEENDYR